MLFIHTGDIHIGCSLSEKGSLDKFYMNVLNEIVEKALTEKTPILISGDLFDQPAISFSLLVDVARYFRRLREAGVDVIVVQGNHDNSRSGRGALDLYSEAGLIRLTRYEEKEGLLVLNPLDMGDYIVYGIPGFRNQAESRYIRERRVKLIEPATGWSKPIIVLAHVSVSFAGFKPSDYSDRYGRIDVLENELWGILPAKTRYIALGHIHLPIPVDKRFKSNIAYPGAPIGMNISDLKESYELAEKDIKRRILLVDTDGDTPVVEAVELESTPKVLYSEGTYLSIDDLRRHVRDTVRDRVDYDVFIFDAKGLKPEEYGGVQALIDELRRQYGKYIRVVLREKTSIEGVFAGDYALSMDSRGLSIEEIEEKAIREYAEKLGIGIPIDRLKEILELLYREKGEAGRSFYSSLYEELKKVFREVYQGGGEGGGR